MYEIWLMMNIVWEIATSIWPALLAAALLWAALVASALRRQQPDWRGGLKPALAVGVGVTVLAVLGVPPATKSSLAEMGYWVDWANLLAIAAGFGAVAAAFAWPVTVWRRRRAA